MTKQSYVKPAIDILELTEKGTLLAGSGFNKYEEESDGSPVMLPKRMEYDGNNGYSDDYGESQATEKSSHQTYNAWFSLMQ